MDRLEEIQSDIDKILSDVETAKMKASSLNGKKEVLLERLKKEFNLSTPKAAKKEIKTLEDKREKLLSQLDVKIDELNALIDGVENAET